MMQRYSPGKDFVSTGRTRAGSTQQTIEATVVCTVYYPKGITYTKKKLLY